MPKFPNAKMRFDKEILFIRGKNIEINICIVNSPYLTSSASTLCAKQICKSVRHTHPLINLL